MSQNGIIGDELGIDLPQKPLDETIVNEIKHKAKYSRSTEYKELRQKAQARIDFYQRFLPNGTPLGAEDRKSIEGKWEVANLLIAELLNLFDEYENAEENLKALIAEL